MIRRNIPHVYKLFYEFLDEIAFQTEEAEKYQKLFI